MSLNKTSPYPSPFPSLHTAIDQELHRLLPEKHSRSQTLFAGARHAVLGGGKRLRPLLTLLSVETLGGSVEHALVPACAIELLHTYSMVHDDLPCMDDDDYRRGRPTVHKQFDEGTAVLVGDFLLTYAFELLSTAPHLSSDIRLQLVHILSRQAGGEGMIGGQMMDLSAEGRRLSLEEMAFLHRQKTGCLMVAAVEFGSVIANALPVARTALAGFAEKLGLAFQIWDDILDVTASHEKHGRATSSDASQQKCTYVSLLGIEGAKAAARQHHQQALQMLQLIPGHIHPLVTFSHSLVPDIDF